MTIRDPGDYYDEDEPMESDLTATEEPSAAPGMQFHISMNGYTMSDFERMVVDAAATLLVKGWGDAALSKRIEDRCIELVTAKVDKHLATVTSEIIDRPLIPKIGKGEPVTMREFIGLTGAEYLSQRVSSDGKPATDSWGSYGSRMEFLVSRAMEQKFKVDMDKASREAVTQIQLAIKARHEALLAESKKMIGEAIAKAVKP